MVQASLEITRDCTVGVTAIVGSSGEPLFDQSVQNHLQKLRGTPLPEPPSVLAEQFLGKTIQLRFRGEKPR